jgi:predicted GH43/DUF377 family glycosyl hydrolase
MKRFEGNPILKPIPDNPWESRMVFNAAAVYNDNKVHILYRAMGEDGVSRIGYASSSDGYHIEERLANPIFEPANENERNGCEDPRLTPLNGRYLMTYTALRTIPHFDFQIGMTSISIDDFLYKRWDWGERLFPFPGVRNKDAVIFPSKINDRYIMYHRIEPDICIASSDDLKGWYDIKTVLEPREDMWDSLKVGAAGPPIEVDEGWLFIYHGVDYEKVYRLGAALIDRNDPETILYRSREPILEPIKDYELFGKVSNVVFSCGSILLDDEILIYYGGADTVIGVATFDKNELIP